MVSPEIHESPFGAAASQELGQDLGWMITRFEDETHGVLHALLLSVDGLKIATSASCDLDDADRLAATASTLIATANAMSRAYNAGTPEVLTFRTPRIHCLLMGVADRAALAVLADQGSNLSIVGHQMRRLVVAVGERLNPAARPVAPPIP